MTPKKDAYMRGYGDGFKDALRSVTSVAVCRKEHPTTFVGQSLSGDESAKGTGSAGEDRSIRSQSTIEAMDRIYRASRNLANNIAEFGTITDGEFIYDMDAALKYVFQYYESILSDSQR